MLELYTARSPVVFKVLIALEEMGLSFRFDSARRDKG